MPYRFTMAFLDLFGRAVLRFIFQLFRFLESLTHGPFSFSCELRTAEVSSYGKDPQALIVTWPHQGSHVLADHPCDLFCLLSLCIFRQKAKAMNCDKGSYNYDQNANSCFDCTWW